MANSTGESSTYWKDMATILVRMKRFQLEVAKFRKSNDIPDTGIPREDRAEWYRSFHVVPNVDPKTIHGPESDYELLPLEDTLISQLAEFAINFNLDSRWYIPLLMYIIDGDELKPPFSHAVKVIPRFNDVRLPQSELYVTRLLLELRKDTSVSDVLAVWAQIENYQAYMSGEVPEKRRPVQESTIKKYLEIRESEDKGIKQRTIADMLGFVSAKEVSDFKREVEQRFRKPKTGPYRNIKPLWWHK